jgi:metal-responsive CopG/Arc/MetJ family transcriptional regulator
MNVKILEELMRLVEKRKRSEFINQAVLEKIKRVKKEFLEKELEEGYKLRSKEALEISKDFETVDLEGWDEY